jgi:hypothetical protein
MPRDIVPYRRDGGSQIRNESERYPKVDGELLGAARREGTAKDEIDALAAGQAAWGGDLRDETAELLAGALLENRGEGVGEKHREGE